MTNCDICFFSLTGQCTNWIPRVILALSWLFLSTYTQISITTETHWLWKNIYLKTNAFKIDYTRSFCDSNKHIRLKLLSKHRVIALFFRTASVICFPQYICRYIWMCTFYVSFTYSFTYVGYSIMHLIFFRL